jgi:hypothetical protein
VYLVTLVADRIRCSCRYKSLKHLRACLNLISEILLLRAYKDLLIMLTCVCYFHMCSFRFHNTSPCVVALSHLMLFNVQLLKVATVSMKSSLATSPSCFSSTQVTATPRLSQQAMIVSMPQTIPNSHLNKHVPMPAQRSKIKHWEFNMV